MRCKILFFCFFVFSFCACKHTEEHKSFSVSEDLLREGDLIVRRGIAISSRVVERADKSMSYSHIGVLVLQNGKWCVIHCVPGESEETGGLEVMKCDSLALFLRDDRAEAAAIYRYDTTAEFLASIADEALNMLPEKIVFDRSYDNEDTTQLYCTEFVDLLFRHQGIDLTQGRSHSIPPFPQKVIYPSDILKNSKLKLVVKMP